MFDSYLRTAGRPVEAVQQGLTELKAAWGDRIVVAGVGTTGSGRELVGEFVGADVVNDEITAHKTGAVHVSTARGRPAGRHDLRDRRAGLQVHLPRERRRRRLHDERGVRRGHRVVPRGAGRQARDQHQERVRAAGAVVARAHQARRALHGVHGARRHGLAPQGRADSEPGRGPGVLDRAQLPEPRRPRAPHRRRHLLPGGHRVQRRGRGGLRVDPRQADHRAAVQRRHGRDRHGAHRPRLAPRRTRRHPVPRLRPDDARAVDARLRVPVVHERVRHQGIHDRGAEELLGRQVLGSLQAPRGGRAAAGDRRPVRVPRPVARGNRRRRRRALRASGLCPARSRSAFRGRWRRSSGTRSGTRTSRRPVCSRSCRGRRTARWPAKGSSWRSRSPATRCRSRTATCCRSSSRAWTTSSCRTCSTTSRTRTRRRVAHFCPWTQTLPYVLRSAPRLEAFAPRILAPSLHFQMGPDRIKERAGGDGVAPRRAPARERPRGGRRLRGAADVPGGAARGGPAGARGARAHRRARHRAGRPALQHLRPQHQLRHPAEAAPLLRRQRHSDRLPRDGTRGGRRSAREHVLDLGPAHARSGAPGGVAAEPAHHLHLELQVRARLLHQVLHATGRRRAAARPVRSTATATTPATSRGARPTSTARAFSDALRTRRRATAAPASRRPPADGQARLPPARWRTAAHGCSRRRSARSAWTRR